MGTLTGADMKALRMELSDRLPTEDYLEMFLDEELDRRLAEVARPGPLSLRIFDTLQAAERDGWIGDLIWSADQEWPGRPVLQRLRDLIPAEHQTRTVAVHHALDDPTAAEVQAVLPEATILDGERARLERVVKTAVNFQDVRVYANALLEQAARVCSISVVTANGRSAGTGFLVGPDVVLTNHHVVRDMIDGGASPTGIECVFDYRIAEDGTVDRGVRYPLAEDWLVASSPISAFDWQAGAVGLPGADELDYALIRLNEVPDRTPDDDEEDRGWIDLLAEPPALSKGLPLLILQHPRENPMKLAVDTDGVLGVNANQTRVSYGVNTLPGSSGSPCFTFDLELVALHHAEEATRTGNEGIPIATIAAHLRGTGHAAALGG